MNVQAGDLARIVGHPENTMAIVRVVSQIGPDDAGWTTLRLPAWQCEALSPIRDDGDCVLAGSFIGVADRVLRKLGDEGVEDLVRSKELQE